MSLVAIFAEVGSQLTTTSEDPSQWSCSPRLYPRPEVASGLPWLQDAWYVGEYQVVRFLSHLESPCVICRKLANNEDNKTCNAFKQGLARQETGQWSRLSASCEGLSKGKCFSPSFACLWPDGSQTIPNAVPERMLKTAVNSVVFAQCRVPKMFIPLAEHQQQSHTKLVVRLVPTKSGGTRWTPIDVPVCAFPAVNGGLYPDPSSDVVPSGLVSRYHLGACVWMKGFYYNRRGEAVNDTLVRLPEWIAFHTMMGVKHFYIYDNGHEADESLLNVLRPFIVQGRVTHIRWPVQICDTAFRSSQHAAINSCMRRFSSNCKWMAHLDVDDYLIPMGKHPDLSSLLHHFETKLPRVESLAFGMVYCGPCLQSSGHSAVAPAEVAFLGRCQCSAKTQTHRPKLIVRPDRVLYHFVHYSVAGVMADRPVVHHLNMSGEGKYLHIRNNFSFDNYRTAMALAGPKAFVRNLEGHRRPCDAEKQTWCWMPEAQRLTQRLQEWISPSERPSSALSIPWPV